MDTKGLVWIGIMISFLMLLVNGACLLAISANTAKISSALEKANASPAPSEEIVKVVGKCTVLFDGIGATTGYVVEGEHGYEVVPFSPGSMADQANSSPEFLVMMKDESGIIFQPLLVQK